MVAIIGAASLGILCGLFGAALIATGILAPLGLPILGLSAAVTSMIIFSTAGLTVGALLGGLLGGLVGTKVDTNKANSIYLSAAEPSKAEKITGVITDRHSSSDATMQNTLGRPTTHSSSSTVADDDTVRESSPVVVSSRSSNASSRSSNASPMSIDEDDIVPGESIHHP